MASRVNALVAMRLNRRAERPGPRHSACWTSGATSVGIDGIRRFWRDAAAGSRDPCEATGTDWTAELWLGYLIAIDGKTAPTAVSLLPRLCR
jgi:hypothetical protein